MKLTRYIANRFRQTFTFPHKEVTHFFPGHMAKGMKQMQRKLKHIDCILEVHDARIPISGRNSQFEETINVRPHILVLNKIDLINQRQLASIEKTILERDRVSKVLFTNCKKQLDKTIKSKLIPEIIDLVNSGPRFHRSNVDQYNVLVIGIPNVGKSSLLNAIRRSYLQKGKASRVGAVPGVTRSVEEKVQVSHDPAVYIYDSPGILHPNIVDMEVGLKLAACRTLKDSLVGEDIIVDYLLYWLNKHEQFKYCQYFNLPEPTDSVVNLLVHIAKGNNYEINVKVSTGTAQVYKMVPNVNKAAITFLKAFREGELGKINLDIDAFLV